MPVNIEDLLSANTVNNGSPPPRFDTDGENRTFFLVEIHLHPGFRDQVKMIEIAQNISDLGDLGQLIYGLSVKNWDQVRDQVDNKVWMILKYC